MTNLLLVCGNIRTDGSRSRQLTNHLVTTLGANDRLAFVSKTEAQASTAKAKESINVLLSTW